MASSKFSTFSNQFHDFTDSKHTFASEAEFLGKVRKTLTQQINSDAENSHRYELAFQLLCMFEQEVKRLRSASMPPLKSSN